MKVLIVDDSPDAATSLAECLTLWGHDVHTAADGGEAMAKMATFRPDVVLLDLLMPRINGWELLDSKALVPDLAAIPVVVLSGHLVPAEPLPADQVRTVLVKPAEPAAVLAALFRAAAPPAKASPRAHPLTD